MKLQEISTMESNFNAAAAIIELAYGETTEKLSDKNKKQKKVREELQHFIQRHFQGIPGAIEKLNIITNKEERSKEVVKEFTAYLDDEMRNVKFAKKLLILIRKLEKTGIAGQAVVCRIKNKIRETKSQNRLQTNLQRNVFIIILSIYASGTLALGIWQTLDTKANKAVQVNTNNTTQVNQSKEIDERIQKEVDRSYGGLIRQFNFALGLAGISVWLLRQSVVNKLACDIEKEMEKDFKRFKNDFKEKFDGLTKEIDIRREINDIIENLLTSIPLNSYFYLDFKDNENRKNIEKLSSRLESIAKVYSGILTVKEWIILGESFCVLALYYKKTHYTNKEITESSETKKYFQKAAESYEKAINIQPLAYKAISGLGHAQRMLHNYEEAEKCYDKVIYMGKKGCVQYDILVDAYVSKGLTLRKIESANRDEKKGIKEGIDLLEEATNIDRMYVRALYNKACYYAWLYKYEQQDSLREKALKAFYEAMKFSPLRCKELAEGDSDFNSIKKDEEFRRIISETTNSNTSV